MLAASKLQPSRTTRANPVHPPPHPRPTIDTDSADLDAVLLDQVTRGKPHTLINLSRFQFPHVLSSWRFTPPLLMRVSSRYRPNIYVPLINRLNLSDSPECSLHVGQIGV
ncbi:hypothetical protein AMECASPLE_016469 [Ameca splendens]|uniref:Uncharacterized protein n=1 Tax=Ameca splendens TaxID=208324 RepID=A0ABV0YE50_9TELE